MPDPNIEPKQSVDDTINKFFDSDANAGSEQPQDAQPETVEQDVQPEAGGEPAKETPTDEQPGKDKGFAQHPAWAEREAKLKEANAKIKDLERSSSVYAKLLDDPSVYKKYLEAQGFDKETIERSMREKGFTEAKPQATPQAPQAQDIAESICKKLNWDVSRLNTEQRAYINDQISLIQAVSEEYFGKAINDRLKPMEDYLGQVTVHNKLSSEYDKAKTEAKNEFPDLDWEKDIEPAMKKYLDELDEKDPKKTISIDPVTLYEKATRQLLKEKKTSEARQEVRNDLKKNARGLTPRPSTRPQSNSFKGKSAKETADNFLDSIGVKD